MSSTLSYLSLDFDEDLLDVEFPLEPGTLIPSTNYRVVQELGRGAMGVVYEAENVEIQRRVALKVLVSGLSQYPVAVEALRAEARASAAIGSPNIVDVYDFITLPDGRMAIAMELLDGLPLEQIAEDGPMEPSRLIGILRQVCRALHAAHERNLVHRDIKPDNVMLVTRDGRADTVKVVDFGIASASGTSSRRPIGTPAYMSPEAILNVPVDGRSDIYSVGCMAYELAVGELPFDYDDVDEMFSGHLESTPVAPQDTDAAVPRALSDVIMRCLSKARETRYEDMNDLEAALCEAQIVLDLHTTWDDLPIPDVDEERRGRILAGMPGAAVPAPTHYGWFAGIAGGLVAIAAIAALYVRSPQVDVQIKPFVPTIQDTDEAGEAAAQARAAAARALYVYPLVDEPDTPTAYQIVLQLEEQQTAVAISTGDDLRHEFADTLVRLGDQYWDSPGGRPFARDYYAQAIIFVEGNEVAASRSALTLGERAELRINAAQGTFTPAELIAAEPLAALVEPNPVERTKKLRNVRKKREGERPATVEAALKGLEGPTPKADAETVAKAKADAGAVVEGEPELDPVVPVPETTADRGDPAAASDYVAKAEIALAEGRKSQAEAYYNKALAARPRFLPALMGLGDLYFNRAKYVQAAKYRRLATRKSPKNATAHLGLGDAYFNLTDYPKALASYERAEQLGSSSAAARIQRVREKMGD